MEKVQGPNKAMLAALAVAGLVLERTGVTPVRAAQSGHITPQGGAKGGPKGGQRASDGAHPDTDHPGADADAPSEIPARGWWHVAKRAAAGFSEDRVMATAAGVTFYAMLAIFPAIASFISLYGLLADPAKLAEQLQGLGGVVPGGGIQIITDQVKSLTSSGPKALGFGFLIGLATSLWSANAGVKAFFDALNVVYHERERRSFIRLTLISFCFTLALIALIILALFAVVVIPVVLSYIGLGGVTATLLSVARWPVMLVAVALALSCMYRYGPSRRHARWRWVSWGSAFAAFGWIVVSLAFSYYVQNFGSYNKTYGSLGAAMGFMTWIWVSAMVVLMGAELNAELEQQTDRDSTIGGEKPAGARGAFKADVKV
jgi:membrane protein